VPGENVRKNSSVPLSGHHWSMQTSAIHVSTFRTMAGHRFPLSYSFIV
jgi:hypothetical protein